MGRCGSAAAHFLVCTLVGPPQITSPQITSQQWSGALEGKPILQNH